MLRRPLRIHCTAVPEPAAHRNGYNECTMTSRVLCLSFLAFSAFAATGPRSPVSLARVPNGGLQPQLAIEPNGAIHMIYFAGDPKGGDLFYVRSGARDGKFSA